MKIFVVLILFFSLKASAQAESLSVSGKIYVRDFVYVEKFESLRKLIEKNAYDVIYETNKYELYLVDEMSRKNAFLATYERLTVELQDNIVRVTLSDKLVVVRRYEGIKSPILDLRLALYELFFGKEYVENNKDRLIKNSLNRIVSLERLVQKQELINEKADSQKTALATPEQNDPSAINKNQKTASEELAKIKADDLAPSTRAVVADQNKASSSKTTVNKTPEKPISKSITKPIAIKSEPSSEVSVVAKKENLKKSRPRPKSILSLASTRKQSIKAYLGLLNLSGQNDEVISTSTHLNFVTLGVSWSNDITKIMNKSFFQNLDQEIRLRLAYGILAETYDVPLGIQAEAYLGAPITTQAFSYGLTTTYENVFIGTIKDIGQGLTLATMTHLLVGPEVRFKKNWQNYRWQGHFNFQIPVKAQIDIDSSYSLYKADFVLDAVKPNNWGMGMRYEWYKVEFQRPDLGFSDIVIHLLSLKVFYQF